MPPLLFNVFIDAAFRHALAQLDGHGYTIAFRTQGAIFGMATRAGAYVCLHALVVHDA